MFRVKEEAVHTKAQVFQEQNQLRKHTLERYITLFCRSFNISVYKNDRGIKIYYSIRQDVRCQVTRELKQRRRRRQRKRQLKK